MRCGEDATDCALKHVLPKLMGRCTKSRRVGGNLIPYEWYATCPLCGGVDKLTLTAKGRNLLRHCQKCEATQPALTGKLAELLPACFGGKREPGGRARQVSTDDLITLATRDLPVTAKNVAMLRLAGISAAEARRILKIPKSSYYRALSELAGESQNWDYATGQRVSQK